MYSIVNYSHHPVHYIPRLTYLTTESLHFFKHIFLFFYLVALSLSCRSWDLVLCSGVEPGSFALGTQSLIHWITREVPEVCIF